MRNDFGQFKVFIQERPHLLLYRVFLSKRDSNSTIFIKADGMAYELVEGAKIDEDEVYFAEMSGDQLQALAEALASKGIKTNKDSIAEGKLSATERHLEDMRTIVLHKFQSRTNNQEGEKNA